MTACQLGLTVWVPKASHTVWLPNILPWTVAGQSGLAAGFGSSGGGNVGLGAAVAVVVHHTAAGCV